MTKIYHTIDTLYERDHIEVVRAKSFDNKIVVIKKLSNKSFKYADNEVSVLKNMYHPNISKLKEVYYDSDNNINIILDYGGITLFDFATNYSNKINDSTLKLIIKQLATAVAFCHNNNVAHRDIKLENICIDLRSLHVTLIDFGLCSHFKNKKNRYVNNICGTELYLAPEILRTNRENNSYDSFSADIWSLGIVVFALLFTKMPFDKNIYEKKIEVPFPKDKKISIFGKYIIRRMLSYNPNLRPSAESIKKCVWLNC